VPEPGGEGRLFRGLHPVAGGRDLGAGGEGRVQGRSGLRRRLGLGGVHRHRPGLAEERAHGEAGALQGGPGPDQLARAAGHLGLRGEQGQGRGDPGLHRTAGGIPVLHRGVEGALRRPHHLPGGGLAVGRLHQRRAQIGPGGFQARGLGVGSPAGGGRVGPAGGGEERHLHRARGGPGVEGLDHHVAREAAAIEGHGPAGDALQPGLDAVEDPAQGEGGLVAVPGVLPRGRHGGEELGPGQAHLGPRLVDPGPGGSQGVVPRLQAFEGLGEGQGLGGGGGRRGGAGHRRGGEERGEEEQPVHGDLLGPVSRQDGCRSRRPTGTVIQGRRAADE
jgi:hypothetical protein